jgi:hypothetical protein
MKKYGMWGSILSLVVVVAAAHDAFAEPKWSNVLPRDKRSNKVSQPVAPSQPPRAAQKSELSAFDSSGSGSDFDDESQDSSDAEIDAVERDLTAEEDSLVDEESGGGL